MTTGILYIAIGERWLQEASAAAAIVKRYMPQMPITLFADRAWSAPAIDTVEVLEQAATPLLTKTRWMGQSPYARTLFLDTDITLCDSIDEIFLLLDRFALAVPHAPYRLANMGLATPLPAFLGADVPACFPGMNSGMLLFTRSAQVQAFFARWGEYHQRHCAITVQAPSQPAFRAALYQSDLRFAILPEEYHCRFIYPFKVSGKVKVLHGRHPNIATVIQRLNQSVLPRVGEGYLVEVARQRRQRWLHKPKAILGRLWRLGPWSGGSTNSTVAPSPPIEVPPNGVPNGGIVSLL